MIERIHKDLLGTGGKDKIHIDEITDSLGKSLGDIVNGSEVGSNANGFYQKNEDGAFHAFGKVRLEATGRRYRLTGNINLPMEALSKEDVVITVSPGSFSNVTINSQYITTTQVVIDTGSRARVFLYTYLNAPPFEVNDHADFIYLAFGRWKE